MEDISIHNVYNKGLKINNNNNNNICIFGKTTKKRFSIFYFFKIFNILFSSDLCFDCFNNRDEKNENLNINDKNLQTNLESLQVFFFFLKKPF